MTIATRLTLIFVMSALAMGGLGSIAAAAREFHLQLDSIAASASSQLRGRPDLQVHIYRRDTDAMVKTLDTFLSQPAVATAIAYNSLGEQLAAAGRAGEPQLASAPFSRVRGDLLTVATDVLTFAADGERREPGLAAALLYNHSPIYLTQPVFSVINPGNSQLTATDFALALTSEQRSNTRWIIGYLHILIDQRTMLAAVMPVAGVVFLNVLLIAALCGGAGWYVMRRVTAPLRQLTQMADRLAAGDLEGPLHVEGSGELQEFARVINGFLGGLKSARTERDVDKRLLNLKVEERTSQLSQRDRELDQAVQEVAQARSRLQHIAHYDPLTQLPNRSLFTEKLALLLKLNQRNKTRLALLFIDLDDFKRINDSLGVAVGDRLLQVVAQRLSQAIRDSDSLGHCVNSAADIPVSRLGGDEFAVVLNQVADIDAALVVARRIAAVLAEPAVIEGHEFSVRPGIGVALAPTDATEADALMRAASIAKQRAKDTRTGDRLCAYTREMATAGESRLRLEADLRRAIDRDELTLHYQPQVDSHSGSVIGAEALLRWHHPERGMVPPGDFIRLAEDMGYMETLGDWVLTRACDQLRACNDAGIKLPRIAINVSPQQFNARFVRRVAEVIEERGVPASQLELGLSEGIMNQHDTGAQLQALRELGVYLSVDDFGTGYSPLSYLGHYPLNELKINRQLLLESQRSENGAKLVAAMIALAHSLELRVLATGVETPAQFRFLVAHGAQFLQGYLLSKPVPADQLWTMLSPWHFMDQLQRLSEPAHSTSDTYSE